MVDRVTVADRRAFVAATMGLIGLALGMTMVVMSLATQSGTTRTVHARMALGRQASELAESAIAESLASFTDSIDSRLQGANLRERLLRSPSGGVVYGLDIVGSASWEFTPARTRALVKEYGLLADVSTVRVTPLYYSLVQNYGEVELAATASSTLRGGSPVSRTVLSRHYFVLDSNGRTSRVNPVAIQLVVDRRGRS